MGSVCIRPQTTIKQLNIDDEMYQQSNLLSSNMMQYDDSFIRNNSMNVNDQQLTVENNDDRKWHDDLIYS